MRMIALAAALLTIPSLAYAGDRISPGAWASRILTVIAGPDGSVTRESYRKRADGYIRYQSAYAHDVYSTRISGSQERATEVERIMSQMIKDAENYVRATEKGVFSLLDPDGDGIVSGPDAWTALTIIARHADIDKNGFLDRTEQGLAEAALARGIDLSAPGARDSLLWSLERSGGFLD